MVKSSLMMPECAGMARGKTLQTVIKTRVSHGNSSSVISVYVQPGIPPLLWVGVAGWIGTDLCFPLSSLASLPGYSFVLQRLLLPNLGTEVWGGNISCYTAM